MPSSSFLLRRDERGRIAERTLNLGGASEIRRYAYDSAGRLARVANGSGGLLESYQYDHEGRRLADINPQRFRGERRFTYSLSDWLGQAGAVQYGHNKAGFRNLKIEGDRETHYRYEPSGLLMAVDLPDGRRIDYTYDASGLRTQKRIDGRLVEAFRWRDPLRLEEFFDGTRWWRLAYDSERPDLGSRTPVGVTNGDDSYLLFCDLVGTPLALATVDGHIVQTMQYDSFGNLLQVRGDVVRLPLGFAGGLFDADTGLTRFVWRDYDADTGRFTALDPMGAKGGDKDWYGYCVDDPVNRVDMWGMEDSWWDGAQKIGDGLGQLWDKALGGIGQAVSEEAKGAREALSKTADAFATNDDLQKYTGIALGAGALPIAVAGGVEAGPMIATTVARNPEKVQGAYDFLSGALDPSLPPTTSAGVKGYAVNEAYNWSKQ
jgi:RHS repeat-associated protein